MKPEPKGATWGNAVSAWLAKEDRSDSELYSLAKLGKAYPDRALSQCSAASFEKALGFCKTAGTYTRYRTMITAILNLAGTRIVMATRKDKKKKLRKWITREQWLKLYAELPAHMQPMAEFAIETGLRQANVLGLTWERVDLKRKHVWIEAEDMKDDDALPVPLSDRAVAILRSKHQARDEKCPFVFTYRGKPIKEIKTAFQAACIRAGLGSYSQERPGVPGEGSVAGQDHVHARAVAGKARHVARGTGPLRYQGFTWHGLRHTWATWHVQHGTPLDVLEKMGGWSDSRMVKNYGHHTGGRLAQFANANAVQGKK